MANLITKYLLVLRALDDLASVCSQFEGMYLW